VGRWALGRRIGSQSTISEAGLGGEMFRNIISFRYSFSFLPRFKFFHLCAKAKKDEKRKQWR
jgi:hypothetical protein